MTSARISLVTLIALVLVSGGATVAQTVELGGSFSGTIDSPGDSVVAAFGASGGTIVRVAVQAANGSSLVPTAVVRNPAGSLPIDSTQTVAWLPAANTIIYVTIPITGSYTVEVGAASGTGAFTATLAATGQTEVEPPPTLGELTGTVTDGTSGSAISGADVYAASSLVATTNASGVYSADLSPGSYSVSIQADGYDTFTTTASITAGATTTVNAALDPAVDVVLDVTVTGDGAPGGAVQATVDITAAPGVTIDSISWTQLEGAPAMLSGADTDTVSVTLGDMTAYKDHLIELLLEPPVGPEQLPPNVPAPEGEFVGGLQDRTQVVGLNHFILEEAAVVVLEVTVVTSAGTFHEEAEIHAELPLKVSTGLRNVPRDVPVLLYAKEQAAYQWTLTPPVGSLATLMDADTRAPWFVPDVNGLYELDLADPVRGIDSALEVFAGTWRGVIVDQNMDGRPVADTACTFCHNDTVAPDKFTPWMETGHAEIFTDLVNTNTHYGENCFGCHTVGFDPEADNGGIDEAEDYQDFLDAGLLNNPGDNWTTILDQFPETALQANIQCENCHGPQLSLAHGFGSPLGSPRVDLSADVCASCHGEPLRHARFQQWQLSAHANYELAIDEGTSGSCSRCHTGNGFLEWLPVLLDDDPTTDPTDNIEVTWEVDETHPQTCATCHDPHAEGTTSGAGTNATVRISGSTPPLIAGFQVDEAGKGAICMTCHNSRRGLRNDEIWETLSTSDKSRAPHGSSQSDMLVGQNTYLMDVPSPGGHAGLSDTCVDCHMRATPPPDELSYNQGGTNHTFYASETVCRECHSPRVTAPDVQDSIQFLLDQVEDLIVALTIDMFEEQIALGNVIDFDGDALITDVDDIAAMSVTESRGRQALTLQLVDGTSVGATSIANIDIVDGSMTVLGSIPDFIDDDVLKAGWNWGLVHNDGSLGVHNPFFASDSLTAARDALVQLASGTTRTMRQTATPAAEAQRPTSLDLLRRDGGLRGR